MNNFMFIITLIGHGLWFYVGYKIGKKNCDQ